MWGWLAVCVALSITPRIHLDEYPKICNSPTSAIIALIRIPDAEVKALTISHIENVLKEEAPRIHDRENQSERTIVQFPEGTARPLLAISDPIIKEKAIIKCMERLNGEIGAGMAGKKEEFHKKLPWSVCQKG